MRKYDPKTSDTKRIASSSPINLIIKLSEQNKLNTSHADKDFTHTPPLIYLYKLKPI